MSRETVGRAMEILLVEDDLDDARMTIEALEEGDIKCRVSLVRDGEEAMTFLRGQGVYSRAPRPDLILLDMQLPKLDGREVLGQIRADEDLGGIPVIVLTASQVHRAILKGEGLHVDGFMTKPVSWDQFLNSVRLLRRDWLDEIILPE